MNKKENQSGFTLVEMIVTVGIAGIFLSIAIPSFKGLFLRNTTAAYTSDFQIALNHAQNEAIKRNVRVTVEAKTTGNDLWEDGWNIFQDSNQNGNFDTATEELIYTYTPSSSNHTLKSKTSDFNTDISFNSFGEPITRLGVSSSAEFRLCGPDNSTSLSRTVKASISGNITVTEGSSVCP